jgi:hypothetical protein
MSLLKTGACFTAELKKPANKTEIAKTFNDCSGVPHVPDVSIPSCAEMASAINASHQAISISGSTITLSGGGSTPSTAIIPAAPAAAPQTLNISGQNLSISGGNTVVLPAGIVADGSETKVTAGANVTVTGAGTTASPYVVTAAAAAATVFATPAETVAGTATALAVNPADLYARENIAAQTGLGLVLGAIPAPTAGQSPWGVNTLGETLHYAPGLGWQIVDRKHGLYEAVSLGAYNGGALVTVVRTAPRSGVISVSCGAYTDGATTPPTVNDVFCMLAVSGYAELPIFDRDYQSFTYNPAVSGSVSRLAVNAGDSLIFMFRLDAPNASVFRYNLSYQYL